MATVLVLAFVAIPLVLTVALTPLALALFPRFRSREIKRGAHQLTSTARPSSRLPLVGGPVLALALTAGAIVHPDAPLWPLAAVGGFFCLWPRGRPDKGRCAAAESVPASTLQ